MKRPNPKEYDDEQAFLEDRRKAREEMGRKQPPKPENGNQKDD